MSEAKVDFAARLNEAFDRLGIPAKQHGRFTALSRLFGVSAVAARDWCEGKSYPSVDKLLVIMDTVRCGADWLLFGRSSAGAPVSEPSGTAPAERPAEVASAAWIPLGSDAMAPSLLPGDQLRLGPLDDAGLEDGLYALTPGGSGGAGAVRIRRLLRRLDGSLELACDNPLYAERIGYREGATGRLLGLTATTPEVQLLGRVIEVRRRLR